MVLTVYLILLICATTLLRNAVVVQPLTAQQIDDFLSIAGRQLAALRVAMREDQELQELVTTPLMLSVIMVAYRGKTIEDLLVLNSLEKRRNLVFSTYVERMLQHRSGKIRYQPNETLYWLSWLAKNLMQRGQTEFYIEQIQPEWLPDNRSSGIYEVGIRLFSGLIAGLAAGQIVGLSLELLGGPIFALILGSVSGLVCGLAFIMTASFRPTEVLAWSRSAVVIDLIAGLTTGLIVGLIAKSIAGLEVGLVTGLTAGLVAGLAFGGELCIEHFFLRWLLQNAGCIPWNYARFLDYAAECILLRKVGGGYIFIHRLLLDYFASLDISKW